MIYFDHNATTPMAPEVFEAMRPWLTENYGNPSSVHRAGRLSRQAIDDARGQVASLLGAQPGEVIFTSGGTEANNLALHGAAGGLARLLVGATEHAAILEPAIARRRAGTQVDVIPVDEDGVVDRDALQRLLVVPSATPTLVSVMWANNETGTVQDIAAIGACVRAAGALMHTDAVQAAGKLDLNFAQAPVDMLSVSAHKLYGPKGVGALLCRAGVALSPLLRGGGHEKGRRPGTENLAGIVGFGAAAKLAREQLQTRAAQAEGLRQRLEAGLAQMAQIKIFSTAVKRVPNTCQFAVPGYQSEALLMALDKRGIAVTSGSACHAGTGRPTHVLLAMGYPEDLAHAAIRVSFGSQNTPQDVDDFLRALTEIVQKPAFAAGLFAGTGPA